MTRWTGPLAPTLAAVLALSVPALACAQAPSPTPQVVTPAAAPTPAAADGLVGGVLAADDLAAVTGGDVKAEGLSSQHLSAVNTGNTIQGSVQSGDVTFSHDALSGFTGVGNFVVNTGSNNNLQGAISINIVTAGP